jgi:hypothetical protein
MISISRKLDRDVSLDFSRMRASKPMRSNSDWRSCIVIRALSFRQSANGCGALSWGEQKFKTSIEVGSLLSIILITILCFYCTFFHFTQLVLLLKLSALHPVQFYIICATLSV